MPESRQPENQSPLTEPYYIVKAPDSYQLSKVVNQLVEEGCFPLGGPIYTNM
ncbi:hypothetical protein ACFLZI_03915 [Nitrospirota bacterium]